MTISTIVKAIQDIMRQDVGVDGDAQRIAQLVWMIFLKIFDDKEAELEIMEDDYQSPLPEALRWRSWAADEEGITGDELLEFVNNVLFPTLKELPDVQENTRGWILKEVFQDSYNYMKSGTLIRQIINKISEIDFNSSEDRHLFNDFYETFLRDLQSAGNSGEYYTPRAVTQFMVDMTKPQLGEKVLDPACGTGGFLTSSLEHLLAQATSIQDRQLAQESVIGIEKKQLPHVLAVTNLILHDIEIPRIRHDNSLSRPLRDYGVRDMVDVVVTNPPFGGIEEDGIQANFPASFRTKETADLFMVLILTLLKKDGRAAVVLPDGFLFGEGVKTRIKEKLLDECNLHTIVRLPKNVFSPYTDIATNLLFFDKTGPTKEIWYYEHQMPHDRKHYSKTKPIQYDEFGPEISWWNNREENQYAWRVSVEEVVGRGYDLDISNPSNVSEELDSPQKIISVIKGHENKINAILKGLEGSLSSLESSTQIEEIKLKEILQKSNEQIKLNPSEIYTQVTVKLWGKGVVTRNQVKGSQIGSEKRNVVRENQLIFSKIDARNGAIGIVPGFLDGAVVSTDFPAFNIDMRKAHPDFLEIIVKTPEFLKTCQHLSSGTTNRVRLKEGDFLEISIGLPSLDEQERIVKQVQTLLALCEELGNGINQMQETTGLLRNALLHDFFKVRDTDETEVLVQE